MALTLSLLVWLVGDELTDLLSGASSDELFGIRGTDFWSYIAPAANVLTAWFLFRNAQHERFVSGFATDFQPVVLIGGPTFGAAAPAAAATLSPFNRTGFKERLFVFRAEVDLGPSLAPDFVDDLRAQDEVPAVACITSLTWAPGVDPDKRRIVGLSATVEEGILIVTVTVAVQIARDDGNGDNGHDRPPYGNRDSEFDRPDFKDHSSVLTSLTVAWIVDTAKG